MGWKIMLKSTRDAIFCTKMRDQKGKPVSAILKEARLNGQSFPSYVILDEYFLKFCECKQFEEFENTINY